MNKHERDAMEAAFNEEFDGIEDVHSIVLHIWKAARQYSPPVDQTLEEAANDAAYEALDAMSAYVAFKAGAQFQAARQGGSNSKLSDHFVDMDYFLAESDKLHKIIAEQAARAAKLVEGLKFPAAKVLTRICGRRVSDDQVDDILKRISKNEFHEFSTAVFAWEQALKAYRETEGAE